MSAKARLIAGIIAVEGGYVDDPADSGGETNWGITEKVARVSGYTGVMRDMPRSVAESIYSAKYWDSLRLDTIEALSAAVAEEMADTGVNLGVKRAVTFLQRSLNVLNDRQRLYPDIAADGLVGDRTVETLGSYLAARGEEGAAVLVRMLNCLQGAFYVDLAERRVKDERFVYGWMRNRVM